MGESIQELSRGLRRAASTPQQPLENTVETCGQGAGVMVGTKTVEYSHLALASRRSPLACVGAGTAPLALPVEIRLSRKAAAIQANPPG